MTHNVCPALDEKEVTTPRANDQILCSVNVEYVALIPMRRSLNLPKMPSEGKHRDRPECTPDKRLVRRFQARNLDESPPDGVRLIHTTYWSVYASRHDMRCSHRCSAGVSRASREHVYNVGAAGVCRRLFARSAELNRRRLTFDLEDARAPQSRTKRCGTFFAQRT
jgi:hypothetical protein